jgi:hypothetical protein
MLRTLVGALVGLVSGGVLAALLLRLAVAVVRWLLEPPLRVEHWVIYLSLILGAGFGALSGALAGLAGAITAALRESPRATPPSPLASATRPAPPAGAQPTHPPGG